MRTLEPEGESIGRYLTRQRELRGISLEELATRTRIPLRSLERLESGAFDGQRDGFVRGFVRTVALDLGLDPDDTQMRMLAEPAESGAVRSHRVSFQALAAGATLAALFLAFALGARWLYGVVTHSGAEAPVVVRHDPVRALAAAYVDSGELATGAAAPSPPLEASGPGNATPEASR